MTEERYNRIADWFRAHVGLEKALLLAAKGLPYLFFIGYGVLLLLLFFQQDLRLAGAVLVPATTLVAAFRLRSLLNFKRPYEKWKIDPLMQKNTQGKSFPSNHTTSAFVIALTANWIFGAMVGVPAMILAAVVGGTRVLCGVHFLRDVVAGAGLGILLGFVGCYLLPIIVG